MPSSRLALLATEGNVGFQMRMNRIKIICENSHRIYPDVDELEDILIGSSCPICGGQIQSITPPLIEVGCSICGWSDNANLNDAIYWLHEGCPNCKQLEDRYYEVHLVESSDYTLSRVKAYRPSNKKDVSGLKRNGRPDYWEILIHFCQIDELISILDQKKYMQIQLDILSFRRFV